MPRFIDIDGGTPIAAAAEARQAIGADIYVNALEFGATGNGTTDDTEALQAWLTHVVTNRRQGWLPTGTYKITETLVAPGANYGWGIHGENENFAIIRQHTSNIPVMQVGTTAGPSHTVKLDGFMLTYNSAQPSTNTNANCIVFEGSTTGDNSSLYWSSFKHLRFSNGYYAMTVASGRFAPWGCEWDMLSMNSMSGGMYDNSVSSSSSCPNNRWGRMTLFCGGAVGPIFKNIRGYNMTIGTLEFLVADQGPQLMTTQAGFAADIGSMKLENVSYTGVGKALWEFNNPCHVRIGSLHVGGPGPFTPSSGILSIVANSGAAAVGESDIEIGSIFADGLGDVSGSVVAVGGGAARTIVRNAILTGGFALQNTGSSITADILTVTGDVNNAIAGSRADADYTVAIGDPNVVRFATAFTAQRTISLPSQTGNNLFNGLYYDLIFDGAINGANTAVIRQGVTTIRTQTQDKVRLRYMWRRESTSGQWILTSVTPLSSDVGVSLATAADATAARAAISAPLTANVQVFTSSGTWTKPAGAVSVRVRCIGPGGGGGAGARGPSGTALSGGGGGAAGGMSEMTFNAADLPDSPTTVTVTVGAGGVGATGQASDGTAGAAGSMSASNTSFGTYLAAGRGGLGGGGGLAVAGAAGTTTAAGYSFGIISGGAGGAGSATGAAGAAAANISGAAGGGAGGGINTGGTANAGGNGGWTFTTTLAFAAGGSGAAGAVGPSSTVKAVGGGGGGGGANSSGAGYTGGVGGTYGGGGGGGGASLNGNVSGGGGAGGDGVCIVTTYF